MTEKEHTVQTIQLADQRRSEGSGKRWLEQEEQLSQKRVCGTKTPRDIGEKHVAENFKLPVHFREAIHQIRPEGCLHLL